MNWVEKYVEDVLSELEGSTIEKNALFINGVTIKSNGSDMALLIYQRPFSDVIAEIKEIECHLKKIDELSYNSRTGGIGF